jgi:hypothetical protein
MLSSKGITIIIISLLFLFFQKVILNKINIKILEFENKGEEISYYAFKGYDCDNFWKSDSLCLLGIQPYIVECHYRSNLYNFPTNYDKMINEGLKIPFNDIKNGDLVLFKKGSFELKESYGIFKDGFVYYKTDIERARNEIEKLINDIEGIRRYW